MATVKENKTAKDSSANSGSKKVEQRAFRKVRQGYVVSDKMQKTIVVEVENRYKHPDYKKVVKKMVKIKAHDGKESAEIGDLVRIMETRPLAKTKNWRVVEILQKAK